MLTSELSSLLTGVEVPVENEASECRHDEHYSKVQDMSGDESELQCGDEEQPARNPGAPTTTEIGQHTVSHWPHRSWCLPCVQGERSRRRYPGNADGRHRGAAPQTDRASRATNQPRQFRESSHLRASFISKRHGGKRSAAHDWVDQDADGRTGGQHQASNITEHTADNVHGEPRSKPHQQILCGSGRNDADGEGTRDDCKQRDDLIRGEDTVPAHDKWNNDDTLDVRRQYGLFLGVAMRTNEIITSGPRWK